MMDSYIRLATSYLIKNNEDWCNGRSYINPSNYDDSAGTFKNYINIKHELRKTRCSTLAT